MNRISIVAVLIGVVLVTDLAIAAEPPGESARVQGRVIDELGNVVAGARITVAVPQADMRLVYPGSGHRTYAGRTDAEGRYDVRVDLQGERSVGVDAVAPGFNSSAGTLMGGGDRRGGAVAPGGAFSASFVLERGTYFAGTVVNAEGAPVPDVEVQAFDCSPRSCGFISTTTTDRDGRFEVFNIPPEFGEGRKGVLYFRHESCPAVQLNDVTAMNEAERTKLRVMLRPGRTISGRVVDASSKPVGGAIIEAVSVDPPDLPKCVGPPRRAMLTDAEGRFALDGMPELQTTVRAVSFATRQRARRTFTLDRDAKNVELQLTPIALPEKAALVELLGMKLATVTPEVRAAYVLEDGFDGVVVVDPGPEAARIGLSDVREGDVLFRIGARYASFASVEGLVAAIENEAQSPRKGDTVSIPIVYLSPRVEDQQTMSAELKLTPDDLRGLKSSAKR